MFNDLSIQKKLYAGFGAIIAMLMALLLASYNSFSNLVGLHAR